MDESKYYDNSYPIHLSISQRLEGYISGYEDAIGEVPPKSRIIEYLIQHFSLSHKDTLEIMNELLPYLDSTYDEEDD